MTARQAFKKYGRVSAMAPAAYEYWETPLYWIRVSTGHHQQTLVVAIDYVMKGTNCPDHSMSTVHVIEDCPDWSEWKQDIRFQRLINNTERAVNERGARDKARYDKIMATM